MSPYSFFDFHVINPSSFRPARQRLRHLRCQTHKTLEVLWTRLLLKVDRTRFTSTAKSYALAFRRLQSSNQLHRCS